MLHQLVAGIVAGVRRRRGLVLAGIAVVLLVSAAGIRQLTFDTDVLSLLPRDGRVIPAFRDYLSRMGNADQLYVLFTAPEEYAAGDYTEEIEAWIDALREAPEIARVDTGAADPTRNLEWLADRRLLLLRGEALDEALGRLTPAGLSRAVAGSRELLAVPSSAVADMVRYDPAGLLGLVQASLGDAQRGLGFAPAAGGYVSADGRRRLVIARPVRPPFDAAFSRQLDARLTHIAAAVSSAQRRGPAEPDDEPLPPLAVDFAGGYRIALETETMVRRESIENTVWSLALILPLLFVIYRSLWLVTVGALPSAFSLVIVLGGLGFAGAELSAAATGASAMLFGLGVDGVVLLYVTFLLRRTMGERDPAAGLGGVSTSMLLGMWTTAATFYGLTFVDFPSLQQLGRLIGHSMLLCGALTLLLIPALLPHRQPSRSPRALTMPGLAAWAGRRRIGIIVVSAVATVVLGAAATRVRVDPTLDRLRAATPAARLESEIAAVFGLPLDVSIALAEGADLDALLEANEQLAADVEREMPGLSFQPPSRLLPSPAAQARTAARIAASGLTRDGVSAALERARAETGFRPGAFEPFDARLAFVLDSTQRLTYEGYVRHGLGDLLERFVARNGDGWTLATYFFPKSAEEAGRLEALLARRQGGERLTGISLVNRELAARFVPEFSKGLAIGTAMVIVLVVAAFRSWRLSLYALLPTAVGLVWTAGILALAGVQLDLFAMFAVVTFLGIGVDYGIHLVHRYHEYGDAERATSELAPVIFVAGAITVLGYGTLVNSSYPPLRSIGVVSAVSVFALAAASVLLLPALLPGRGRTP